MDLSTIVWAFVLGAYQVAVVLFPHPEAIRVRWLRAIVAVLGRLSLLRHEMSPGTFHLLGTAQPGPRQQAIYLHSQLGGGPPLDGPGRGPDAPPLQRRITPALAWLGPAALLLLASGCSASLVRPRDAVGRAYLLHGQLQSELSNYDGDEGRAILDRLNDEKAWRAAIDAHRKACDFARKLLDREFGSLKDIGATMGKPPAMPSGVSR